MGSGRTRVVGNWLLRRIHRRDEVLEVTDRDLTIAITFLVENACRRRHVTRGNSDISGHWSEPGEQRPK
jgi:hypothetical protein